MVMQDGQETPQDEISQDQYGLDAAQTDEQPPQFVTMEQYNQLLSRFDQTSGALQQVLQTAQQQSRHITGLESRIDRQANEARRQAIEKSVETAQARMMEAFEDPDQRRAIEEFMAAQKALLATEPTALEAPPQDQVAPQQQSNQGWADLVEFVRGFGVDPQDPRINYAVLVDETKPYSVRRAEFAQSIRNATAQEAAPAAPPVQQQTPTPPQPPGPVGPSGYRTVDDVYSAFIENRIDQDAYKQALARFGVS